MMMMMMMMMTTTTTTHYKATPIRLLHYTSHMSVRLSVCSFTFIFISPYW